jgi:hypothetical protein
VAVAATANRIIIVKLPFFLIAVFTLGLGLTGHVQLKAAEPAITAVVREYASVRFMGDETSIVWPDGNVTKVLTQSDLKRPKDADYRMFWLTISLDKMSKQGFEFVYMDGADVIMRRSLSK